MTPFNSTPTFVASNERNRFAGASTRGPNARRTSRTRSLSAAASTTSTRSSTSNVPTAVPGGESLGDAGQRRDGLGMVGGCRAKDAKVWTGESRRPRRRRAATSILACRHPTSTRLVDNVGTGTGIGMDDDAGVDPGDVMAREAAAVVSNAAHHESFQARSLFTMMVLMRPRSRGARRSLIRTFSPGARAHLSAPLRFRSRHTASPFNSASDAFQLHPDVRFERRTLDPQCQIVGRRRVLLISPTRRTRACTLSPSATRTTGTPWSTSRISTTSSTRE